MAQSLSLTSSWSRNYDGFRRYMTENTIYTCEGRLNSKIVKLLIHTCMVILIPFQIFLLSYYLIPLTWINPSGSIPISSEWSSCPSIPASASRSWNYDVFLSFRGGDTRNTFVNHLYNALVERLINTYKDDKTLPKGDSIAPSLMKAIEESRIAIIVFSRNFASSWWCLDELTHIMKCREARGLIVVPIFYDVKSSEVRNQKGEFGKVFAKQEKKNINKAESWRKALEGAGNIHGWGLKNIANGGMRSQPERFPESPTSVCLKNLDNYQRWNSISFSLGFSRFIYFWVDESEGIKLIVDTILDKLFSLNSDVDKDLVGMKSRSQSLKSQLKVGFGGVQNVGIWGVGGGGKSTLAFSVYKEISHHFQGHCFVDNIWEESIKTDGLKNLQEKIISTFSRKQVRVLSVEHGKHMIKQILCHSNVLIVLDDVDHLDQLDALAGSHDWFGDGSRIIITTRDEHLLKAHKVDEISVVSLLSHDEAIELLHRYAYHKNKPVEDFEKLSLDVVSYAAGLPLALKVLGRFLYDKDKDEWISTLARLKEIPEIEIVGKLKFSYDGLKSVEKELFLDIACFFRGWNVDDAMEILDVCGLHFRIGIKVLEQKALITTSGGRFDMHDLVQGMGYYIVRGEHPNNPYQHTMVWQTNVIGDICFRDALKANDKIIVTIYDGDSLRCPELVANMRKLFTVL